MQQSSSTMASHECIEKKIHKKRQHVQQIAGIWRANWSVLHGGQSVAVANPFGPLMALRYGLIEMLLDVVIPSLSHSIQLFTTRVGKQ